MVELKVRDGVGARPCTPDEPHSFPAERNPHIMNRRNLVGHVQQIIEILRGRMRLHGQAMVGMSRVD